MAKKSTLLNLRDVPAPAPAVTQAPGGQGASGTAAPRAPSRVGQKAMTGYFSPDMSIAMHVTARKNGLTLQQAMGQAFNDWLRKMGESPVGD